MKIIVGDRHLRTWRGIRITHATPDGGPVFVDEASWRTVNGFVLNSRRLNRYVMILFRRTGKA